MIPLLMCILLSYDIMQLENRNIGQSQKNMNVKQLPIARVNVSIAITAFLAFLLGK